MAAGAAAAPNPIGELNLVRTMQGVSLRYLDSWLRGGFALSEDLPLVAEEFLPPRKVPPRGRRRRAARPLGEQVIRVVDKPARLSLLEYLYFAGDDRFGALGVSTSADEYLPRRLGPLPTLRDADRMHELVLKVLANEPVPQLERRLVSPGATMGGAKPKGLIAIDGEPWVVKFAAGEPADTPLIEHAAMTLAESAGIRVAPTKAIRLVDGHAVAVKRFDRSAHGRVHALSAYVALRAAASRSAIQSSRSCSAGAARPTATRTSPTCASCSAEWSSTS